MSSKLYKSLWIPRIVIVVLVAVWAGLMVIKTPAQSEPVIQEAPSD